MKLYGARPKLTYAQVRELLVYRDQRNALPTVAQLASRYGISESTVRAYLRDPHRKHHGREVRR